VAQRPARTTDPFCLCILVLTFAGGFAAAQSSTPDRSTRVVLDTDANNELDDQHVLASALLSGKTFQVEGLTVNFIIEQARALYDDDAVSVVKNPAWATRRVVGSYRLEDGEWVERGSGPELVIWELFYGPKILQDFFDTHRHSVPAVE